MTSEFIQQNLDFFIFFVGILWGILLDGMLVEKGRGYIKIKFVKKSWQFKGDFTGFIFYIIEIIIITLLMTFLFQNYIRNLLINNFLLIVLISFGLAFLKFRKEIYGRYL